MMKRISYYITDCVDPLQNLAMEEYFLHRVQPQECMLYLWQNQKTVVIGRNQNAWNECRVQELEDAGGTLVRRLSGGGAVYHDLGNLNFTFLVRHANYDVEKQTRVISDAIRALGMPVELTGRNDMTIDGQKFSGHAYYRTQDQCYHHGTLMVNVDHAALGKYLQVSKSKLEKHSVQSVRSRVTNLIDHCPNLTIPMLEQQLVHSFGTVYHLTPEQISSDTIDWEDIAQRKQRFAQWEWRFGSNSAFTEQVQGHFGWGETAIRYTVQNGKLQHVSLQSDGLEADYLAAIPQALEHCSYALTDIAEVLRAIPQQNNEQTQICRDVTNLFKKQFVS